MPYLPVAAGGDLTLLQGLIRVPGLVVLIGVSPNGVGPARMILHIGRSQRQAKRLLKTLGLTLATIYVGNGTATWVEASFPRIDGLR